MGLSDEERLERVYNAVKKITGLRDCFEDEYPRIQHLIDELWPALEAGHLPGISFDRERINTASSLMEMAILTCYNRERYPEMEYTEFSLWEKHCKPRTELLLDKPLSEIVELYDHTEDYMYAANRYRDSFSAHLRAASAIVARLRGEIYGIVSSNDKVLRAWAIAGVVGAIIKEPGDPVTDWWVAQHLHHDIRIRRFTVTEAVKLLGSAQKLKVSDKWRVSTTFRLIRGTWKSELEIAAMLKIFKPHKQYDQKWLEAQARKCMAWKEPEPPAARRRHYCHVTQNFME